MTGWLWIKVGTVMVGTLALASVAGSTAMTGSRQGQVRPAAASSSADPNVIDYAGLRGIRFGASMNDLIRAGAVATPEAACGPTFPGTSEANPVFDGGSLVLIWADAPLRTPEGVGVGASIDDARRAYPGAIDMTPPAGSYTFPGLLVPGGGDRAYLMLYDQGAVQKLVVGYEKYARQLFETGFGSC